MEYQTLAAVDLGSNSFHLAVGRVAGEQIYPLDAIREPVRLGAGLGPDRHLDADSQARALAALKLFAERLAGHHPETVRAVGTNTLRVAKNAPAFLKAAEKALGFPIEVISGREEARLIYLGVVHSLPIGRHRRLVVDIGGGSTEFIIGTGLKPALVESLYMGCVSWSRRFFPEGKVDKPSMRDAELAAREKVEPIVAAFRTQGWDEAVGSSGSVRAIFDILEASGRAAESIDAPALEWLRDEMIAAGHVRKLALPGLRDDRLPVLAGGVAILSAIFIELGLERMTPAKGALRQGVLWDLLGRVHHRDIREVTVDQFVLRYGVSRGQAQRVGSLSLDLFRQIEPGQAEPVEKAAALLGWAAKLHEIGISIAQGGYHKHSAYVLANAEMPGFSRQDQGWLSNLVLAQRGRLPKMKAAFADDPLLARAAACLRLAVIFHRSRRTAKLPPLRLEARGRSGFRLSMPRTWLAAHSLVAVALESESHEWAALDVDFCVTITD